MRVSGWKVRHALILTAIPDCTRLASAARPGESVLVCNTEAVSGPSVWDSFQVHLNTWPGYERLTQLRQWPVLEAVAERVASSDVLDGLVVLGSFAAARADDVSDLDLVAVVAPGWFDEAWRRRDEFESPGALLTWDYQDGSPEEGVRKWLTRDVVKVELVLTTGPNFLLAEPAIVGVGSGDLLDRFPRTGAIPPAQLETYAASLRAAGEVPEAEIRYGELMAALRRARG